ncbi:hypothetical protein HPMBJEAJ_00400 [Aeromonas phage avDM6]|nr:hypothetical protein HPMBJEAJ_00400 [Aeromonas phage avDM6]
MNKDMVIGQRVTLDPKSKYAYTGTDPTNPVGVSGTVIPIPDYRIEGWPEDKKDPWVWVLWDNDHDNCYPADEVDLIEVVSLSPNSWDMLVDLIENPPPFNQRMLDAIECSKHGSFTIK